MADVLVHLAYGIALGLMALPLAWSYERLKLAHTFRARVIVFIPHAVISVALFTLVTWVMKTRVQSFLEFGVVVIPTVLLWYVIWKPHYSRAP